MYLLFDFDGTLVDSFHCVMGKAILLAEELKFRKINQDEIEHLRNLSALEIIRYLDIPIYKIPQIIYQMRKHLHHEMERLQPITHMPQVVEKLCHAGFSLGILTSNSKENVVDWLESHHLQHYFHFIRTESRFLSKKYLLKKTLKIYKINPSQTFYIGDETRDVDAAKKNKVKSIAVTWGYNSEKTLLKCQPTHIIRNPEEILTICGL